MAWAAAQASCCPGKAPCALAYTPCGAKCGEPRRVLAAAAAPKETTEATNQRATHCDVSLQEARRKARSSCFSFFPPARLPLAPPRPMPMYDLNVIPKTGPNRQTRARARTTQSGHSNPNRNSSCTPALAGLSAPADSLVLRVEARAEGGSRPGARPLPLSPAPPD